MKKQKNTSILVILKLHKKAVDGDISFCFYCCNANMNANLLYYTQSLIYTKHIQTIYYLLFEFTALTKHQLALKSKDFKNRKTAAARKN